MTLEELRKARSLSQEEVAEALTVNQPAVAKLEKRGDMHVSNLRRYIEALGGTLEITAQFDKTTVVISNIGETAEVLSRPTSLDLRATDAAQRGSGALLIRGPSNQSDK
jgi:transcriptional regulator with XRE-family HTH domain